MLKHASVYLTLIAAILYTLGLNYYQGFLSVFGLEESMFPLTFDQTIFTGYLSMVQLRGKPILWLLIASEVALIVVYFADFLLKRLQKKKTSDTSSTKTTDSSSGTKSKIVFGAERLFTYAVVVFLFLSV